MDFLNKRFLYFIISWILAILSVVFIFAWKLNLGIDMTGWVNIDYSYSGEIVLSELQESVNNLSQNYLYEWQKVINNTELYKVTWENIVSLIIWFDNSIELTQLEKIKINFRSDLSDFMNLNYIGSEEIKYTNIWKSFWDYIRNTAILTLFIAIIAISLYVAFAFSGVVSGISVLSFSIITIITLFHDVVISTWLYIFSGIFFKSFQIDTFFVTAMLTILGYSINDTIVVFDRIRSNLKKFAGKKWKEWKDLYEIINLSINETLRRSIYTSLTLVFVLFTIFVFGPESLSWFIFALMLWTIIGTYSSIFIASPLLYEVNKRKKLHIYKKIVVNPEDKIVV